VVVLIDDDFTRAPTDRQERLSERWVATLHQGEPIELATSGAELVAEARAEAG
jgi:hypothetical protein